MSDPVPHLELRSELLAHLEEHAPRVDRDRVAAAFDYAALAHEGQRRVSGEPYVTHLVEVCRILLQLLETRLETTLACAALLHDVVEDTPVTPEDVEKRFGKEVAGLVEGVTKLSGLHFERREAEQADNFRKMVLSMSRDLRVIFIKLADRLHNMRTVSALRPEKARRIAEETRDIYAPLAHRLGIASIKRELEDLALKTLDAEAYAEIAGRIQAKRDERQHFVEQVRGDLKDALKAGGIKAEVTGRPKHFFSIYTKMKTGRPFDAIHDLSGLRVITHSRTDCYRALGVVHDVFTPVQDRFKDYIATPKSNMYQSLHTTVLVGGGELVEVQIRTRDMHHTAETGVAAHYVYKQGGKLDAELDAKIGGFVASTAEWQEAASDDEYMDFLKTALYQEEVFVYTPRRELKRLPKGATPLDFAFLIHTEVGQKTVGARVNGELVPLRHELRNGDTVEIITSPQAQPREDWLKFLRTTGARTKVRHWMRLQRLSDSITLGRQMLERELKRLHHTVDEAALDAAAHATGCSDVDQLYARLAEGQLSLTSLVRRLVPEKESLAERLTKGPLEALGLGRRPTAGIRIDGVDNVMVTFARCCQPVPGDAVLGVVTLGRGVSVHRIDCPNTFPGRVSEDRRVPVEWNARSDETFPVRLLVYGQDRTSLLADIAKTISTLHVNVRTAGMASEDKTARGMFVVEVPHVAKLDELIGAIRRIKGVTSVERRQRLMRRPPQRRSGNA
ncbi:MAG: bifunctional (p)ppGpp synthetase/guanosine-3',5'-bis(diphosphate) 3'-pyrophosphohydrolase [Candidatus Eisenbacteria bacterium]|uniref:Bifunctional (P)ppGpp synthetase/guanosine-3',5'-bis(Diphosphate) 3'-pyrophosphohydrolase n=1 Tax=Eiseniibacteriota bacterium TaxID=2212470 RepID=A0A849SGW2_UNCEI|nr:bifunctional (p)ppGpp synthetase/guanosine-3',5'-bis(diphosphate) 3'-pyrophosphohydrolase [Candidatus Eisenbacteria bacterium]